MVLDFVSLCALGLVSEDELAQAREQHRLRAGACENDSPQVREVALQKIAVATITMAYTATLDDPLKGTLVPVRRTAAVLEPVLGPGAGNRASVDDEGPREVYGNPSPQ